MLSAALEAHDEARLARIAANIRRAGFPTTPEGDPDRIAEAWGVTLPESYRMFMRRHDGGALQGPGGVLSIWTTTENLALQREDYRAFKSTPGARVVFFASDNGACEYFFDVDDYYGHGRYAVLVADQCSDTTFFVGATFYEAAERILNGPRTQEPWEDRSPRPRPQGSERT